MDKKEEYKKEEKCEYCHSKEHKSHEHKHKGKKDALEHMKKK